MNKQDKGNGKRGIEWQPVVGYEGFYEVSNRGEIKSLPRATTQGGILRAQMNNSGYLRVSLTMIKSRYLYVHHLVAAAFIGPRPDGSDINHINGCKTDNRPENLEYMTRTENMKHAREHGLYDNRGEHQWNAKLTEDLVHAIWRAYRYCGANESDITVQGVSRRAIKDVLEGKTWRHIDEQAI